MKSINKILVVLNVYKDFRNEPDHLPLEVKKALRLVSDTSTAHLVLVGCGFEEYLHEAYSSYAKDAVEQRKVFCQQMEDRLQIISNTLMAQGVSSECKVHWTYPRYEQIAKEALDYDVDLVVQHVNPDLEIEHNVLSNDSWQLVRTCPKPLLLTKGKEWPEQPVIMAAVDPVHKHHKPLQLDNAIIDVAKTAKNLLGGELHIVHAYAESARIFNKTGEIEAEHRKALDELLGENEWKPESIHMVDETPVLAIIHCQDELDASIIVLGALSRSRISDAIIGNTAEQALDYAKSDLLIIKPA
jgi:universal stress protein E